jgi:hypothetical protein
LFCIATLKKKIALEAPEALDHVPVRITSRALAKPRADPDRKKIKETLDWSMKNQRPLIEVNSISKRLTYVGVMVMGCNDTGNARIYTLTNSDVGNTAPIATIDLNDVGYVQK